MIASRVETSRARPAALAFASLLLIAAAPLAAQVPAPKNVTTEVGIDQKLDAQIPLDLVFRDESGATVRLGDYFDGRPVVLNLVYFECPMLCNMTMDGLVRTLNVTTFEPGKEFTLLTVSFDHREGPKLAAGAKRTMLGRYGREEAHSGWHFLTGDERNIRALADAVGFRYVYDPKLDQYAHGAGIIILTGDGRVSKYLNGVEFAARDLRLALVDASESRIGTATDQVLLLCYEYDPVTGKYGLAIWNSLRIAGTLTVALLAGTIVVLLRRERRSSTGSTTEGGRLP